MTDADDAPTRQTSIQPFDDMNRYEGRHDALDDGFPIASDEVYAPPRRTRANGWVKFHAHRDCGEQNVRFVEHTSWYTSSERHEYRLYCFSCRYKVDEHHVLFIGGDWWSEHGWRTYGRPLDDLYIPPERVLELGPDPDEDELKDALYISGVEYTAGPVLFNHVSNEDRWGACRDCGHAVPIRFDERCRMCYDGPWTERLQNTVDALERQVREHHNDSFGHRLERHVDPLSIGGRAHEGSVLWRRHAGESVSRMVVVTNVLEDLDDGHREYRLQDPTYTSVWMYREDDLADCFWDTGLDDHHLEGLANDELREAWQHVCEHRFRMVYRREDGELVPAGEQCPNCRKWADGDDGAGGDGA